MESFSEPSNLGVGLRQGDPLLFNIVLEKTIRQSGANGSGLLANRSYQILALVDDVTILARFQKELREMLYQLEYDARYTVMGR